MRAKHSIRKICEYCKNEFNAGKATTRYCSHKCNSRAYKEAKRIKVLRLTDRLTEKQVKLAVTDKDYLSIAEVAKLVGLSRWTIYRYVVDGKIPSKRFSKRTTRIRRIDIELFFDDAGPYKVNQQTKEDKIIVDWYTLKEITKKYGILRDQIRKIVNREGIPEKKRGLVTYIAKNKIDNYFKKNGFDSSIVNLAEWYTVKDMMNKFNMTNNAVYSFTSKYRIPKKQLKGKRYYSRLHVDTLKNENK